jgi:hypothetical protein
MTVRYLDTSEVSFPEREERVSATRGLLGPRETDLYGN